MISENVLTKLTPTGNATIVTIPSNGKNDIIQIMCRAVAKHSSDTSLFFNQIIQTHKNYKRKFEKCNLLGDSNSVEINSASLESDLNNYYWRSGSFDRANYNAVSSFHYYRPNGTFVFNASTVVNENTSKVTDYRTEYNITLPAKDNFTSLYRYNAINNLPSSSAPYNPSVTTSCYVYDTVQLILKPETDISYSATLNTGGLVPLGGNIGHTVNNSSSGSSYTLNYFTDTISGASGSYATTKPGYIHSGYKITDSYGCSSDSTAYNLFQVDMPVGVKELLNEEVNIFPNPFTDQFTIETENIVGANIRLYNLYGSLVYQSNGSIISNKTITVPGNIPKGTYILQVIGEKNGFSRRITKI